MRRLTGYDSMLLLIVGKGPTCKEFEKPRQGTAFPRVNGDRESVISRTLVQ